jgi:hypothetical protein
MRFKVRNAIVCEFLGPGERGKILLINVYSNDIAVDRFPAVLQLGIYLEIEHQEDVDAMDLAVEIFFGNNKVVDGKIGIRGAKKGAASTILMPNNEVRVGEPTSIEVFVRPPDGKRKKALKKNIVFPSPAETQQS